MPRLQSANLRESWIKKLRDRKNCFTRSSGSSVPLRFKGFQFSILAISAILAIPGWCLRLRDRLQHVRRRGVIAEGFAHVDEEIFVPRRKNKAAAKLQRIFAQAMLLVSCGLGPFACLQIVFAEKVQQRSMAQADGLVRFALVVDQKRELDASFFAEESGIAGVAQADHGKMRAFLLKLSFKFAQLRDVLSAENSTVVTKEDHDRRSRLPQGTEARWLAIGVRERDSSQLAAE